MSDSEYWGDVGDEAAEELRRGQMDPLLLDQKEFEWEGPRVTGLEKAGLFSKIEFKWKTEDKLILDRIRIACESVTSQEFRILQRTLDELYDQVRVPVLNQHENPVVDSQGRIVWQKDEYGRPLEDWKRLDGMDLEIAIFNLQKSRIEMSTRTNELLQEALFAKHIYNDSSFEGYQSLIEGTQGDRTAHSNRVSREEKYFSFYKYCLWTSADTLLKEIMNLQRIMERIRQWRIQDYKETQGSW